MQIIRGVYLRDHLGACVLPLLLAALAVPAISGCYWLRYYDLMETHVELMEQLASNATDVLETGQRALTPSDIVRLRYPLERARQFAEIARRRYADRESLAAFDALIAAYGELHGYLDRVRAEPGGGDDLVRIRALLGHVRADAARTRSLLRRERG